MAVGHKVTTVKIKADLPSPPPRNEAFDVPIEGLILTDTRGIKEGIGRNTSSYLPNLILYRSLLITLAHNHLNILPKTG